MKSTIGEGVVILVTSQHDGAMVARVVTFVAIDSAFGTRRWRSGLARHCWRHRRSGGGEELRRDPHDAVPSCWLTARVLLFHYVTLSGSHDFRTATARARRPTAEAKL
jgi:hypothetical protein